jgi:hypothetical protein
VLDTASMTEPPANVETGAGVLARLTFRSKTAGLAGIAITVSREPLVYPSALDTQNEIIFVDRIGGASLAIGQDCPAETQAPIITDLAQLNQQILADNPELAGGEATPAAGSPSLAPTAATSPTTLPCAAPPRPTPWSTATNTPVPPAEPTPSPTELVCTPTPTPLPEEILSIDDDSKTTFIAGAALLTAVGSAAAGSGWYLYRRSRRESAAG